MKNSIKLISALLIVIIISAFTVSKTTTLDGYAIGDIATDFELLNVDDNMVSMSDFTDAKGFIITFTCKEYLMQACLNLLALKTKQTK